MYAIYQHSRHSLRPPPPPPPLASSPRPSHDTPDEEPQEFRRHSYLPPPPPAMSPTSPSRDPPPTMPSHQMQRQRSQSLLPLNNYKSSMNEYPPCYISCPHRKFEDGSGQENFQHSDDSCDNYDVSFDDGVSQLGCDHPADLLAEKAYQLRYGAMVALQERNERTSKQNMTSEFEIFKARSFDDIEFKPSDTILRNGEGHSHHDESEIDKTCRKQAILKSYQSLKAYSTSTRTTAPLENSTAHQGVLVLSTRLQSNTNTGVESFENVGLVPKSDSFGSGVNEMPRRSVMASMLLKQRMEI